MIVSDTHQLVILAPWKCASQTLHATLDKYNTSRYDRFFHFSPRLGRVVHQHITLGDFLALPESGLGYRVATFVRNPYDRAFSGFLQIQRDFNDQPKHDFQPAWVGDLVRTQIADNMKRIIESGFNFDKWIINLPEYEIFDIGRNTNMPLHPAHYWTHSEDRAVDFIGKVEEFEKDFYEFCQLFSIEFTEIKIENASNLVESSENSYPKYKNYISRYSIDKINEIFSKDFEIFNYERL